MISRPPGNAEERDSYQVFFLADMVGKGPSDFGVIIDQQKWEWVREF